MSKRPHVPGGSDKAASAKCPRKVAAATKRVEERNRSSSAAIGGKSEAPQVPGASSRRRRTAAPRPPRRKESVRRPHLESPDDSAACRRYEAGVTTKRGGAAAAAAADDDDDDDDRARVCGICFEPPRSFGILSCCDHAFCHACIMGWRRRGSSDVESRRVCPTCRRTSDYVVPSSRAPPPADDSERELLLRNYRARRIATPCKNFVLGVTGSCPFGRDCFYAHSDGNGNDVKAGDRSMQELYEMRRRDRDGGNDRDLEYIADMLRRESEGRRRDRRG